MLMYGRSVTTLQNQLMPTSFTKSRVAGWLLALANHLVTTDQACATTLPCSNSAKRPQKKP